MKRARAMRSRPSNRARPRVSESAVIGRAGSSDSASPGNITFLCPKCVSGVRPTCVHSKPTNATRSGSLASPARWLHSRRLSFVSRQCAGVSDSAWSFSEKKSSSAQ